MVRPLIDVPADSSALAAALVAALDGSGPAVRPVPRGAVAGPGTGVPSDEPAATSARSTQQAPPPAAPTGQVAPARPVATPRSTEPLGSPHVPSSVAVVLRTSGSTGDPRDVLLSAAALRASAEATQRRLGGPGDWLLVLPPDHVAGLQVVLRALAAGTSLHRGPAGPFRPRGFAAAAAAMGDGRRRYTSLVPTQLARLLDDGRATDALRGFDAVLLGGAATPAPLLARAHAAGVRLVTTYGMTETCGGCVYDGVPLDGIRVAIEAAGGTPGGGPAGGPGGGPDAATGTGRVLLAGPVLAEGYLGRPDLDATAFVTDGGARWLRTNDLGTLGPDGRLAVLGRVDDVIVTGGVNVAPAPVEELLHTLPGVREACVVGVPDDEWGQAVVAVLVVGPDGPPALARVRELVTAHLGAAAAPRRVVVVPALPTRGPGKPDRRAAAALAAG